MNLSRLFDCSSAKVFGLANECRAVLLQRRHQHFRGRGPRTGSQRNFDILSMRLILNIAWNYMQ